MSERIVDLEFPEQEIKEFRLGSVLSVTTGILVSEFGDMWALMDHLTGQSLMTHDLVTARQPCQDWLFQRWSWLEDIEPPVFNPDDADQDVVRARIEDWVAEMEEEWCQPVAAEPGDPTKFPIPKGCVTYDPGAGWNFVLSRMTKGRSDGEAADLE